MRLLYLALLVLLCQGVVARGESLRALETTRRDGDFQIGQKILLPLHGISSRLVVDVKVGDPAQSLSLVVDTFQSSLIFFNYERCFREGFCYDYTRSRSFHRSCGAGGCNHDACQLEGTDGIQFLQPFVTSAPPVLEAPTARLCISRVSQSTFYWNQEFVAGIVGLKYHKGSPPTIMSLLPRGTPPIAALDLNIKGSSYLQLGAYDDSQLAGKVVWAEQFPEADPQIWFPVKEVSMCGAQISDEVYTAIVVSTDKCLGLPAKIYDHVMSWVGAYCNGIACSEGEIRGGSLPDLQLTLAYGGEKLRIPLADLLVQSLGPTRRFCIIRMVHSFVVPHSRPMIQIGTLAMNSLLVVLDMNQTRVGLANKRARTTEEVCMPVPECATWQQYDPASNICIDPACADYWFQRLDNSTGKCVVLSKFRLGVILAAVSLGALHIMFSLLRRVTFTAILADPTIDVLYNK